MRAPIFQVDAFATKRFTGNPAAVVLLDAFPDEKTMQAIAAENNLAETAFVVRTADDYRVRWFTPTVEVPFCGHATLAAAAVILRREPAQSSVEFQSASGPLKVGRQETEYLMDFPARRINRVADDPELSAALHAQPVEVHCDNLNNYIALFAHENTIRNMKPDLQRIEGLKRTGVIVTAPGEGEYHIVSRYFAPGKGIPEDPVTGGAHCALTPFWAERTGRLSLRAYQASPRGGEMRCRLVADRVELRGSAVFYLEGEIEF